MFVRSVGSGGKYIWNMFGAMRRPARKYISNIFARRALAVACLAACAAPPAPTPSAGGSGSSSGTPTGTAAATPTATATVAEVAPSDASVLPTPPADPPRDLDASADAGPSPAERAIVAKLKTVHKTLLACHQVAKSFGGDFTLAMVIGSDGKVTNIAVTKRSSTAPAVASCILDRVRVLKFDIEPTKIEIPFHFVYSAYDGPVLHYGSGPYDPGY